MFICSFLRPGEVCEACWSHSPFSVVVHFILHTKAYINFCYRWKIIDFLRQNVYLKFTEIICSIHSKFQPGSKNNFYGFFDSHSFLFNIIEPMEVERYDIDSHRWGSSLQFQIYILSSPFVFDLGWPDLNWFIFYVLNHIFNSYIHLFCFRTCFVKFLCFKYDLLIIIKAVPLVHWENGHKGES